jgi:hypothetical protein
MSSKIKHNKKRNTAFLYEALVRELTKASIKKDENQKNIILRMLKESFNNNSLLSRELKLYQNILNTEIEEKRLAEKIIFESRLERSAIDNKKLFNEQSALISRINKELSQDVYSNFVPNYKDLATLQQIFNNPKVNAKTRVLLEESIVSRMTSTKGDNKTTDMHHIDNIVYKSFIEKFNKQYSSLTESQKALLKTYIASIGDDLEMKIFMDEELERLKEGIANSEELEVFPEQKKELIDLIGTYSQKDMSDEDLIKVLKIQQLLEESKENA